MNAPRIVTIGVYGYTEERFFAALREAGVDLLCDIRRRRGVRGAEYAFANSARLQHRLAELGIRYHHAIELSPTTELRRVQYAADEAGKVAKRARTTLDPAFAEAFARENLAHFSPAAFLAALPEEVRCIAFLCVEHAPEACHRSLVADKFAQELNLSVTHIQ
jgi:uncharacterized protein (DUF488 family)